MAWQQPFWRRAWDAYLRLTPTQQLLAGVSGSMAAGVVSLGMCSASDPAGRLARAQEAQARIPRLRRQNSAEFDAARVPGRV